MVIRVAYSRYGCSLPQKYVFIPKRSCTRRPAGINTSIERFYPQFIEEFDDMGSRILGLVAVLAIVSVTACSKGNKDTGVITTDGGMNSQIAATTEPVDQSAGGPAAGTQQDLVVNVGDRVFFGYDKHDLAAEARTTIEKQAQWLKTYPHINISIEGHCDERGTREYNLALGEKRATAVRNYLVSLGVEASRLQTISYGKERPVCTDASDSCWAQNRRGVLVVQ
jgi:peptidoglycan-associated lipoprotein